MKYTNLSGDNHLSPMWYPKDLYQERLPAKFREAGPKVVETPEGTRWSWEGDIKTQSADGKDWAKCVAREFRRDNDPHAAGIEFPEIEEGLLGSDPRVMLPHMDMDGTYAAVYFGDQRKGTFKDPELEKAVYSVYNDWAVETSMLNPDRVIILPTVPSLHPEMGASEVYRLADKGARAVELCPFDTLVSDPAWEPMWTACEETGVVVCSHIGDKTGVSRPASGRKGLGLAHFSTVPFVIAQPLAHLIFGGVLERHPKLKYLFAECRIGWLPFQIQWLDRNYQLPDSEAPINMLPSEYIKRQVRFTFEEDHVGTKMLHDPEFYIRDTAIWGGDYPHGQGTWPWSEKAIDQMFQGLDEKTKQAIIWDRTAEWFAFKGPGSNGANGS